VEDQRELEDYEKLNSLTTQDYKPEVLALEAPKQEIWNSISEDNKAKEIAKEKEVKKFEVNTYTGTPSSNTGKSSSGYTYTGSGYSSSYYSKSSEDIVDKDFGEIRSMAYKMADAELSSIEKVSRLKNNPQLNILMKKRTGILQSIKQSFAPGTWGRKALLITGMIILKGAATMLVDARRK
jgi:hypothetical protein